MAVLDEVPGIEVSILVNGQKAIEYVDPHASKLDLDGHLKYPVVTKYIESIDDAEFSVKLAVDDDVYAWDEIKHGLAIKVEVDGSLIQHCLMTRDSEDHLIKGQNMYSEESQQWYCRTMKFSAISTVESRSSEGIKKDIEAVKNIGCIQISFERHIVVKKGVKVAPTACIGTSALEVSEKALKHNFVSHSISLNKKETAVHFTKIHTRMLLTDNGPFAVFRFIYRSKERLRNMLIIPRSPEPEPAVPTASLSINNLAMADVRRLAQERLDQINWAKEAKIPSMPAMKRHVNEVVDVDEEAHSAKRPAVSIDLTDD
ncbi:hypothetical protein F5Y12DRAFT_711187 [Xylaria sp. FL1777]|nr:hypothetical protein F5Y12DRAFT_711187 [Xylaria sp. FL1777]